MENTKTKKVYLTKKRKTKKLKARLLAWLIVGSVLSGVIMYNSIKLNESIEGLATINEKVAEQEKRIEVIEVFNETIREVTAYNVGDVNQTDSTPCEGAKSGVDLCEAVKNGVNVCAANFVPLGTKLQIIANNGWEFECIVWDRMNSRYLNRVDIAMSLEEHDRAIKFGLQNLTVRVLGDSEFIN